MLVSVLIGWGWRRGNGIPRSILIGWDTGVELRGARAETAVMEGASAGFRKVRVGDGR